MSHRLLHTKWLYQRIHKVHHTHINTVFYATACAHPIEILFGNIIPSAVGPLILGNKMHFTACLGWFIARNFESIDGHCGYEFSWSPFRWLPFATPYGYHAYHHSHNVGNYSSMFLTWDTILGSNVAYNKYMVEFKHAFASKHKTKQA